MKRRLKQIALALVASVGLSLSGTLAANAYNSPDPNYGPYPQVNGRAADDLNLVVNTGWPAYISKNIMPIFGNTWETQDGVRSAFPNRFKFLSGTYDPDTKTGLVKYQGWAHYSGHPSFVNQKPVMNMRLADPEIRISADAVELLFQVSSSPFTTEMDQPGQDPINRGKLVLYQVADVADFHAQLSRGKDFALPDNWVGAQGLHDIFGFYQAGDIAEALSGSVLPVSKFTSATATRVELSEINTDTKKATIKGYNFNVAGPGYYAAFAPQDDYASLDRTKALWILPPGSPMAARLPHMPQMDSQGNWEGQLDLPEDAATKTYQLLIWPAHSEPGADNLLFVQELKLAADPEANKPNPATCTPQLSHAGLVERVGGKVKVNGTGYKTESPGIYVAIVPTGGNLKDAYGKPEWVGGVADTKAGIRLVPETNAACGSFSIELSAPAASETGQSYEILTVRAHGMDQQDPSQSLRTPLLYLDPPVAKPIAAPAPVCKDDPNLLRITGGELNWGLKKTFTTYIRSSITKGKWETSNGVSWNGETFVWKVSSGQYNIEKQQGRIDYSGTIHFTGHNGVLDLTISNPSIVFNGPGNADLYLSVSSTTYDGKPVPLGRVNFAKLNAKVQVAGNSLTVKADALNLSATGAKAFAGFYESGQSLDGLSSTLSTRYVNSCDKDYETIKTNALAATGTSAEIYLWLAGLSLLAGAVLLSGRAMATTNRGHRSN